jgi:hypothetical protein
MYIDDQTYTVKGKTYRRVLLRNSYRKNGKICHDTIASLTSCSDEEINAIKRALQYKKCPKDLIDIRQNLETEQGLCVGAVWLFSQMLKKSGVTNPKPKALEKIGIKLPSEILSTNAVVHTRKNLVSER